MTDSERFVLVDGSITESSGNLDLIERIMHEPTSCSELYLKDLLLLEADDDDDCNDGGLRVALKALFQKRIDKWDELSIDNCTAGSVANLLSWIFLPRDDDDESSSSPAAPVASLLLDSVVFDENISSVVERIILLTAARSKHNERGGNLEKLQIIDSTLTYIYVAPMLNALAKTGSSIETLVFSGCTFDQSAVVGLAAALRECQSIKSLDISSCNLSDENLALLLNEGLKGHPTLQHLDIRKNNCSTKAIAAIEAFLQATNVLKTMEVTLPHDAEIPSLNVSRKRRRVAKHRTLNLQYTRRNPLNDNGVEFSCSVVCQLKVV